MSYLLNIYTSCTSSVVNESKDSLFFLGWHLKRRFVLSGQTCGVSELTLKPSQVRPKRWTGHHCCSHMHIYRILHSEPEWINMKCLKIWIPGYDSFHHIMWRLGETYTISYSVKKNKLFGQQKLLKKIIQNFWEFHSNQYFNAVFRNPEDLQHIVYSEESFFKSRSLKAPLWSVSSGEPIFLSPNAPWTNLSAFRRCKRRGTTVVLGRRRRVGAGQPPGGAVGEGKWSVIKQAATETPSTHWVYEAVTSSRPLTMKEETPFFFLSTDIPSLCFVFVFPCWWQRLYHHTCFFYWHLLIFLWHGTNHLLSNMIPLKAYTHTERVPHGICLCLSSLVTVTLFSLMRAIRLHRAQSGLVWSFPLRWSAGTVGRCSWVKRKGKKKRRTDRIRTDK